jgi:hypothetical protein
MDEYQSEPVEKVSRTAFRMDTGLDVLASWSDTARQSRRNVVYKALFAMIDGSVFRDYRIIEDFRRPSEFFVVVRDDLVIKLRVHCFDSFGVVYIGPPAGAEGAGTTLPAGEYADENPPAPDYDADDLPSIGIWES